MNRPGLDHHGPDHHGPDHHGPDHHGPDHHGPDHRPGLLNRRSLLNGHRFLNRRGLLNGRGLLKGHRLLNRRGLGAAGVAVALLWAGPACAIIPTGSPAGFQGVVQGDPLRKPYVRVVAMPPSPSWTPTQVLEGFLSAMASVDDPTWRVARQYLTPEAAAAWQPGVGVTVYDKRQLGKQYSSSAKATENGVTLHGTVTATIDHEGKYTAVQDPDGEALVRPFRMIKGPYGWRITDVANGLLLTEADVRRTYRPVKLYYLDHSRKGLVVDEVRIPLDPTTDFAESMVRRLLQGPTAKLKDAVSSALPAGTTLHSVWTEDGKIIVDLNEAAANAIYSGAGDDVEAMAAQIGWTLNQLTERWEVEIRVNGEPFYPTGGSLRVGYDDYGRFDAWLNPADKPAYFVKDGGLDTLDGNKVVPVPGQAGQQGQAFRDPAVSAGAPGQVAVLTPERDAVEVTPLVEGGQWRRWITGKDLTAPSWDRYNTVWTVERLGPRSSQVLRHDGQRQVRVSAPGLQSVGVRELRVARDGVRVAAVVEDEDGLHVRVGSVVVKGNETQIASMQNLLDAAEDQQIVDIAWKDATTLLVLTGSNSGQELLAVSVTDGTTESFKADARFTSITAMEDRILAGVVDSEEDKREILYWDPVKSVWSPLINESATSPVLPLG